MDALFLEDSLDAQHLLDLVADRELVLEHEREVLAEMHGAVLLVSDARCARNSLRAFA